MYGCIYISLALACSLFSVRQVCHTMHFLPEPLPRVGIRRISAQYSHLRYKSSAGCDKESLVVSSVPVGPAGCHCGIAVPFGG